MPLQFFKIGKKKVINVVHENSAAHFDNLNTLRCKMAMTRDIGVAQLPPAEASFTEHVKRAMWQNRIWTTAHIAKPELGSPEDYGWKKDGETITPVLFEGDTAADHLQGLVCDCNDKVKRVCQKACSCT